MVGETSIIQEKNDEPAAELYRSIGEGYKAMREKREITLEELEKKMEQITSFCTDNSFKPLSEKEILDELEEARACYQRGEYKDFDDALDEIDKKYGL